MTWPQTGDQMREAVPQRLTGSSFLREVARGNVTGAKRYGAFGEAVLGAAQSWYDISPLAQANILYPGDAGLEMSIKSTSADDAAAGTGIRSVDIHYLDANGVEANLVVVLTGQQEVVISGVPMRWIECVHAQSVGSGYVAAGDITIYNGANTYAVIKAGYTRCTSSARMVPAGKRLLVTDFSAGITSGANAAGKAFLGSNSFNGDLLAYPLFIPHTEIILQETSMQICFDVPMVFPALAVVKGKVTTDKAATAALSWRGWYESAT